MLFLEGNIKLWLTLHLFSIAILFYGLGLGVFQLYFSKIRNWVKIKKVTVIGAFGYLLTFVLGLLIYPVFRVKVRAEFFDPKLPWATGLFEVKEWIGAFGLFAAFAILLFAFIDLEKHEFCRRSIGQLLIFLLLISIVKTIIGFVLTGIKSI